MLADTSKRQKPSADGGMQPGCSGGQVVHYDPLDEDLFPDDIAQSPSDSEKTIPLGWLTNWQKLSTNAGPVSLMASALN